MMAIILKEAEMDAQTDEAIRRSLCRCFPVDIAVFSMTRKWHGTGPEWTAMVRADNKVIAHAGFVDRTIRANDELVKIAGVQNVFVLPEHRGKGLCDCVMNAGMSYAREQGFDMGLLFCKPEIFHVYEHCGWRILDGAKVTRIDETGSEILIPEKNGAMYYPLRKALTTNVVIHLNGNDW